MLAVHIPILRLSSIARRFVAARYANVAIIFALSLIPILGLTGAAIDLSRANAVKTSLQAALDSTALMASKNAATLTSAQVQSSARSYFLAMFTRPEVNNVQFTASYSSGSGSSLLVTASADMPTDFMAILGFKKITVTGTSTAKWGSARLRVALVLDTTGSMASDGKIGALKTATKNLLTQLQAAAGIDGDVYVSIIPFSRNVNLDSQQLQRQLDRLDRLAIGARYFEKLEAEQLGPDRARLACPLQHHQLRIYLHDRTGQ